MGCRHKLPQPAREARLGGSGTGDKGPGAGEEKGTEHFGRHRKGLDWKLPQESRPRARNSSIGRMLAQNLQSPMLYLRINRVWWQEDQEFKIRLSFIRSSRPV